jgi:pimeloyl-ACP methyl ester carboxylesterase
VTRTCSYDRAGRPWSDPHPSGDLWQTAETLHELLAAAEVSGPYVLAGHSIGGLYVRAFQARYPNEVGGVALIDSSQPDQFERYPELAQQDEVLKRLLWTFPWMARVGLFRLFFARGGEIDFQDLPPSARDEMAAQWSTAQFFESLIDENNRADQIFAQAHDLGSLGDLPLAVVTAAKQPAVWSTIQNELAGLSSRSRHVTIEGATHGSLAFNPAHASQTAAAIVELVQRVRSGP